MRIQDRRLWPHPLVPATGRASLSSVKVWEVWLETQTACERERKGEQYYDDNTRAILVIRDPPFVFIGVR